MKRNACEARRRLLRFLVALPIVGASDPGMAQSGRLKFIVYYPETSPFVEGAQLFADRLIEDPVASLQVLPEWTLGTLPFPQICKASALALYCSLEFAGIEPVLGLSALPMLAATFDEAETLLRVARPYYDAALSRNGQVLLATQPWRPAALWSNIPIRSHADFIGASFALVSQIKEKASWQNTMMRLGTRGASEFDAELILSDVAMLRFSREFSYFAEVFCAAPLSFLTVSREVLDSLTDVQRKLLLATGRDFERLSWNFAKQRLHLDQQEIASRGVLVTARPPPQVSAALRKAAEADIQNWTRSAGMDGVAIIREYRGAVGRL